jgi:hypothetical protein
VFFEDFGDGISVEKREIGVDRLSQRREIGLVGV